MRAIILLRTNPGFQERAYEVLERISVKGVELEAIAHCYGRFDGVIICKYDDLKSLNVLTEILRREGVFHTETLIAIE